MKQFRALSTFQIRFLLKRFIRKKECYVGASDQLQHFPKHVSAIVNNMDSSSEGEHWLAIYSDPVINQVEVWDSYGIHPQFYGSFLTSFSRKNRMKLVYHSAFLQSPRSSMCGYFSVYFLVMRNRGYSFQSILNKFKPYKFKQNENIIRQFFKHIKYPIFSDCKKFCQRECKMTNEDFSSICVQKNKSCFKI